MRVLIAPSSFGGPLDAVRAATAIATGWSRQAPADVLSLAPVSDGGKGFLDVVHAARGGELTAVVVPDMYGEPTPGSVLLVDGTAYVEASQVAQAAQRDHRAAERATSLGIGQLAAAARATGANRVVVGVGAAGPAPNDGGAGLLAALGATSEPPTALTQGAHGLAELSAVDVSPASDGWEARALVLATDDETPLLGLLGTTNVSGVDRGLAPDRLATVDRQLEHLASLTGRRPALLRGAGAGGGVGYALLVAGALKAPGLETVAAEIALAAGMARADLVVTGEAALDFGAGSGRVSAAVARFAAAAVRPCVALAGRVTVGARETRALGIESAYGVADTLEGGGTGDPATDLASLAERVARTWSWGR